MMLANAASVRHAGGGPGAGARDDRWLTLTQLVPTMRASEPAAITPQQVQPLPCSAHRRGTKACTAPRHSMRILQLPRCQHSSYGCTACMDFCSTLTRFVPCRRRRCCCPRGPWRRGRWPSASAPCPQCPLCRWTRAGAMAAQPRLPCKTAAGTAGRRPQLCRCRQRVHRIAGFPSSSSWWVQAAVLVLFSAYSCFAPNTFSHVQPSTGFEARTALLLSCAVCTRDSSESSAATAVAS